MRSIDRAPAIILLIGSILAMSCSAFSPKYGEKIKDRGDLKVFYGEIREPQLAKWKAEIQKAKILEGIAGDLNSTLALPTDIILVFDECGTVNAQYNPEKKRIEICYELIEYFYDIFSGEAKSEEELNDRVVGATIFISYHELGHALLDVCYPSIAGKEEEIVDQLSTIIIADGTDEGKRSTIDGALSFYPENRKEQSRVDDLAFWKEHSLSSERLNKIVCLVKAEKCKDEYTGLAKNWNTLLAPYLKN